MRAKSDIINVLKSQLSDDIWKKLQNSLLGRELIAFAAEVISENENVKDTMLLQMNPETADKNGLYMLSQINEIPITNIKPSCVVVEMANPVKTYAPYELTYSVGNVHFTNIEYTMQGKSVSLINGTHKCKAVGAVGMDLSDDAQEGGEETYFFDGNASYFGIKLGNAYPDSIVVEYEHVYNNNTIVTEMPRYSSDIALSNDVDMMYKVVTGVDGSINIRFMSGDSSIQNPAKYKIDWLDHSAMEFEVDDNEVKDGNTPVATIKYYSQGTTDDLEFMRNQLKKEMAKYNGLNTPASVESYVRGLPYVLDARCERDNNGLNVYIKPSSKEVGEEENENNLFTTYLDFSEVAAHISLNSILFPNIKIAAGRKLNFGIAIGGITEQSIQNSVRSLIQDIYAYDKMGFNTTVNVSQILAEIYTRFGIVPSVTMTLKEDFRNNEPLSYVPVKNTLKGFGADGLVTMTESDGVLYGKINNNSMMSAFEVICCIGTMVLLKKIDSYTQETSSVQPIPIPQESEEYYSNRQSIGEDKVPRKNYNSYVNGHFIHKDYIDNKFYLLDLSSNSFKPYDATIKSLLRKDTDPCLLYDSWGDKLGGLQDLEVLSTNNGVIFNFIFNSNGTNQEYDAQGFKADSNNEVLKISQIGSEDKYTIRYKYWKAGKSAQALTYFLDNKNAELDAYQNPIREVTEAYKGKFQTSFCVKNTNGFKNLAVDSMDVAGVYDGIDDWFEGFYQGFKGVKDGKKLGIKANAFYYENDLYYLTEIKEDHVILKNKTYNQKMTIPIAGAFKGMVEKNGVLYVIQEDNITVVEGFSGIKQKCNVYRTYKNLSQVFKVDDIVNGMDGGMIVKSSNKFYCATNFEISGSIIMFKDLEEIFIDLTDTTDPSYPTVLGSCTSEYATAYTQTNDDPSVGTGDIKLYFHIYNLKQKKTISYHYTCDFTEINDGVYQISNEDTNMGGEQAIIGYMDYGGNKIFNQNGVDIDVIRYEGLSANVLNNTYLVLDENEITFTA